MLSAEKLKSILDYNPETGLFKWRPLTPTAPKSAGGRRVGGSRLGRPAGAVGTRGYVRITIEGRAYPAHRLAWLWVTGVFPEKEIDHVNRDTSDNRFSNLREATRSENGFNRALLPNNTSGVSGVVFSRADQRWLARIGVGGRKINLGSYRDKAAAIAARKAAEVEHFGHLFAEAR